MSNEIKNNAKLSDNELQNAAGGTGSASAPRYSVGTKTGFEYGDAPENSYIVRHFGHGTIIAVIEENGSFLYDIQLDDGSVMRIPEIDIHCYLDDPADSVIVIEG